MAVCDICNKPVEPGQPRFGCQGNGGRSGPKFNAQRHYGCHTGKYGRAEPSDYPAVQSHVEAAARGRSPYPPSRTLKVPVVTKGEYNRSQNAAREFRAFGRESIMGRSRVRIECPFCADVFWAYIWSISGGGKKCPNCKAMHTSFGQVWPLVGNEDM